MERKEAIEVIKKNYPHVNESGSQFETALRILIPELKESEDERIRKALIDGFKRYNDGSLFNGCLVREIIAWLEKQGEQKPTVWSEEDDKKRKGLIKGLEDRMGFGWASDPFSREEYIDWLKSLRPQWKPSDEQMKAIEHICDGNYNVDLDILDSIYRDFRKLREE